jgi:microcystin-dependent protein
MKTRTNATVWAIAVLVTVTAMLRPSSAYFGTNAYVGEMMWVPYNFAPNGFEDCNGQIMSIAQNTALFSLLGTMYGGNGQTTFALPDMRGRSPLHVGQGPGLSNYDQGQVGGQENVTLTTANLPPHNHTSTNTSHTHDVPQLPVSIPASSANAIGALPQNSVLAVGALGLGRGPSNLTYMYNGGPANTSLGPSAAAPTQAAVTGSAVTSTNPAGASATHENRQPYLVIRCVIATSGVFPPRNIIEIKR